MKKYFSILVFLFLVNFGYGQVTTTFRTNASDFTITNKEIYKVINNATSQSCTIIVGAPQLPVTTQSFALPAGAVVSNLSVVNGSKIVMGGGNLLVYPAQPPCIVGKPCPDFTGPDPAIYNSNTPFPATTATISNDVTTFGYRVVTINICPFEYLPKDKLLYRFDQINITINYIIGAVEYTARISQRRHEINQDFVKGIVQNPKNILVI